MKASLELAQEARTPLAGPSLKGLSVVHLTDFEEAVPLSPSDRNAYRRRFATLFADDAHRRQGGLSQVTLALDTRGERLALKTLLPREGVSGERLEAAFRREYETHLLLNGMQGFPRLYGFGYLDGTPAIVMEWIRGITLRDARAMLAANDRGQVPSLMVARIGRALFELLVRMERMDAGIVHRDLSPANVMVRTDHLSLDQQAREGAFDLCLVDLGSAEAADPERDTSLTSTSGVVRGATADYAPPEMLTADLPDLGRLRRSPKIDVYAAGSILYELMSGNLPFDLKAGGRSAYRIKVDETPALPQGLHASSQDLEHVLAQEPEVATEVAVALLDLAQRPGPEDIRRCLVAIDDQLAELVLSCLERDQERRPTADGMRSALDGFCTCHAENVRRALAGERLLPCTGDGSWYVPPSPLATRRTVRAVGTAVSAGIWLAVVVGTSLLVQGARATAGPIVLTLWAPLVGLALALPGALGLVARGSKTGSRTGFLRGSIVLAACSLLLGALVTLCSFDTGTRTAGLLAAVFATFAAGWCPLVLDYATTLRANGEREPRKRLMAAKTDLATSPAGSRRPSRKQPADDSTSDDVTYEVPDDAITR